ncbi:MAG TPA: ABC transporter permease [Gemmatimonadaceae bacterium]|jgi:peptide/nickel transport system permease protein|nr:ABC transporter permease [Gemmatimonadaceae bacterium]
MKGYVARRIVQAGVIVFLVATLSFFLLHLAPGDPFTTLDSPNITEAVRAQWRTAYGLDRPLPEQYLRYLRNVARGDLGYSYSLHRPVSEALASALPNTLLLMGVALVMSFAIGILLGVLQARHRGSGIDHGIGTVSLVFFSMPDFWLAIMMLLVFAYWIPIFPVNGMFDPLMHAYYGFWGRVLDRVRHLVLPAVTLTLLTAALISRYQRAAVLDVLQDDFVRTARAKGLGERRVMLRHVLRNALLPIITLMGLLLPALLGGAVFVEKIFAWPGMGYLTVNAIATRDYPLVTAAMIIAAVLVAVGSLLADLLSALVDPRLRSA